MAKKILIPLPALDFDPTEAAIPWQILTGQNISVTFATPAGKPAQADARMLTGKGLGILAPLLVADKNAQAAYTTMTLSKEFQQPITWQEARDRNLNGDFDGLVLPGGHAPGMKSYLESTVLQKLVVDFFIANKLVGAICHGVVLAARSRRKDGHSVLWGRKTTALLQSQEMTAWLMTCLWLKNYYRTYPESVQSEVTRNLADPADFLPGPTPITRDSLVNLKPGFVVEDRNYVSARWPGDAHSFALKLVEKLNVG